MTDEPTPVLDATYDLSYRPAPGSSSYFCLDILYRSIGDGGAVKGVENWRGGFRRSVDRIDPDGAVRETITWKHTVKRDRGADTPFGEWQALDFADDFTYPFCAEDDYPDFQPDYSVFPRGEDTWPLGWNVLLLTVDAHFEFDFLRSRRHGAIDRLRRIGDSCLTPDTDHPFRLELAPVVDVPAFTKRDLRNTFIGLAAAGGEACGIVAFGMEVSPFQMTIGGHTFDVSSIFRGTLTIRLGDGSLEHGEFDEFVMGATPPVYPRYEIRRIDEATWQGGTGHLVF
jgi:hypothetical protein